LGGSDDVAATISRFADTFRRGGEGGVLDDDEAAVAPSAVDESFLFGGDGGLDDDNDEVDAWRVVAAADNFPREGEGGDVGEVVCLVSFRRGGNDGFLAMALVALASAAAAAAAVPVCAFAPPEARCSCSRGCSVLAAVVELAEVVVADFDAAGAGPFDADCTLCGPAVVEARCCCCW